MVCAGGVVWFVRGSSVVYVGGVVCFVWGE